MRSERIKIGEEYYLLASALAPRRPRILLNHADSFAIFDLAGDIPLAGAEEYGLFHRGTRFLDRLELHLDDSFPVLLNSATSDEGSEIVSHLANSDQRRDGEIVLERDTVAIERRKTLLDDTLYESLHLHNYGRDDLDLKLSVLFAADFADMFELRGVSRSRRGELMPAAIRDDRVVFAYRGLDGVMRKTEVAFLGGHWVLGSNRADLRLRLQPGQNASTEIQVRCGSDRIESTTREFESALTTVRADRQTWSGQFPVLYSNNEVFNDWINRSLHDLALLRTVSPQGSYVYAGIPWFATVFGRDGLITALETLAFAPELAKGTLRTLAARQGERFDPQRDEEPGKILHEMRHGEMAAIGEVPFGRYYGSVDSTPLFLVLLSEYMERTADLELLRELWPAAVAAMEWIDGRGDADGDGYVEYARRTSRGLINQGWKDSHDAISHADGSLAEAPIALAEVQAYVYAARCGLARAARRLQRGVDASTWEAKAAELRDRFNRDFWWEEEGCFVIGLDGEKQPCRIVSSNAGHCLFGGIAELDKAQRVLARLMRDDMFCGWGIRTLSSGACRYNPMSYHNGSVWPHDNAVIAAGFSRYGGGAQAGQLLTALFDTSLATPDRRLPELFCGFPRRFEHQPVPYPVACKPQAWAAGSVFLLLQAVLGLSIEAWERRITFHNTALPRWLERLEIRGLCVRDARVDLSIVRSQWGAAIEVIEKEGDIEIVVRK